MYQIRSSSINEVRELSGVLTFVTMRLSQLKRALLSFLFNPIPDQLCNGKW